MENAKKKGVFSRFKSLFAADGRRMAASVFAYILLGICLVVPVLILVMTTMTEGSVVAGNEMQGFENAWEIIGAAGSVSAEGGAFSLAAICNINMVYFAVAVLTCLFVAGDFKSGYVKNLFSVHAKKGCYVLSKVAVCSIVSAVAFLLFLLGTVIGGGVAGLSFEMNGFNLCNLSCSMLSKIALLPAFVAIFLLTGVIAKKRTWLSICLSLAACMFLFMIVPMVTPVNSTLLNVFLCAVFSCAFVCGLGAVSVIVLKKTDLV